MKLINSLLSTDKKAYEEFCFLLCAFSNDAARVTSIYFHDVKIRFVNINDPSVPKKTSSCIFGLYGIF